MATADDARYYTEHDDHVRGPRFRHRKGRGPFRYTEQFGRPRNRAGPGGVGPNPRARFEDGDVVMKDSSQDGVPRRRFNPYGKLNRRGYNRPDRDRRGGGAGGHGAGPGAPGIGGGAGRPKSWFKMTIMHGKKYDKKWLLTALKGQCSVPFTPVEYHIDGNRAHFYVEDATTANAVCKAFRKITGPDGCKVSFLMRSCPPPAIIQAELKPEDLEHLKQCMLKRFDGSQQALDLNSIRTDPDLVSQNIEVILNRKNCMQAVIKIIEESIPELECLNLSNNRLFRLDDVAELVGKVPNLKTLNLSQNELRTERELDKIKGFKLVKLWLDQNPLCDHFKDQPSYINEEGWLANDGAVRERFPRLLKLDGHDLPPPIGFDVDAPTTLPPCKGCYFVLDEIKCLILRFLQQYYSIYDSGSRQPLLDAYHDGACFSLSIPSSVQNPSSLGDYHKDSRNIKRLKDPTTRFRLLRHPRLNVVAFLNELPKTQHDTTSFTVDVNTYTSSLLSFTVSGVFKEVDGRSRDAVRAFSRVFIAVPAGNNGLCLVNDELFVRNATTEEIRKAFATPAPTPSSSPVPTLSALQEEMLLSFYQKSGMNLEWSQKCLQDNDWDFNQAAQIFIQLKVQGKIPGVAFVK